MQDNNYRVPENVAVSDSGFIFLSSTGETFTLNAIGREIFSMLQKGNNSEEIFSAVLNEYDIDKNTFEKDFSDFINQLQKYQLIKEE